MTSRYVAAVQDDQATLEIVPFATLSPDTVIEAIESDGYDCDGRVLALGSYENRVYQVGLEDADPFCRRDLSHFGLLFGAGGGHRKAKLAY